MTVFTSWALVFWLIGVRIFNAGSKLRRVGHFSKSDRSGRLTRPLLKPVFLIFKYRDNNDLSARKRPKSLTPLIKPPRINTQTKHTSLQSGTLSCVFIKLGTSPTSKFTHSTRFARSDSFPRCLQKPPLAAAWRPCHREPCLDPDTAAAETAKFAFWSFLDAEAAETGSAAGLRCPTPPLRLALPRSDAMPAITTLDRSGRPTSVRFRPSSLFEVSPCLPLPA